MATVKKTTTATKPKTTTSKVVNNKVTTTKPSTTVTKPSTAPKTPTKTGSNAINNKVTATTPKVSNDTYVPMMGSVLGDYYSNQKTNGTVNNNSYTKPGSSSGSSSSGSSSSGKSGSVLQSNGQTYQYNSDGSYKILNSSGNSIGWGAAGTEYLQNYDSYGNTSGYSSNNSYQQQSAPDYSALLKQLESSLNDSWGTKLNGLQSNFDKQIGDWTNKYSTLESTMKAQQEESAKQYQALLDKYNYSNSLYKQQMGSAPVTGGATDGSAGGTSVAVDGVTNQNSYNDTLYKYLQNIWKGGF